VRQGRNLDPAHNGTRASSLCYCSLIGGIFSLVQVARSLDSGLSNRSLTYQMDDRYLERLRYSKPVDNRNGAWIGVKDGYVVP
jgi:hypothetical protein